MQLQAPEIEFVTFDTQDVIATSGGPGAIDWTGKGLLAHSSLFEAYNNNYGGTDFKIYADYQYYDPTGATYYTDAQGQKSWKPSGDLTKILGSGGSLPAEHEELMYRGKGTGYYLAADVADIVLWLAKNNYPQ